MMKTVAIAGGGLAGLSAAKHLSDAGVRCVVFEGQKQLGGRASTFRDDEGDWVEQGLHVFLGAYSEFKRLLRSVGLSVDEIVFWMDEFKLQEAGGASATFGTNPFYAPFRTLLGLIGRNGFLGPFDKFSLALLTEPALFSYDSLRRDYDNITVVEWWKQSKGTQEVLERVLRPFCRAVHFTDAEDLSAFAFLGLVHQVAYGLRQHRLGGYRGPRNETIFEPLAAHLRERGAEIRTCAPIDRVAFGPRGNGVKSFKLADGEQVVTDAYVLAMPAWNIRQLVPPKWRHHPFFAEIFELPVAPAISVQLWLDRRIIGASDFHLVGHCHVPVYQEQSLDTYPSEQGGRISAILSPADDLLEWDDEALVRTVVDSLGKLIPFDQAKILKSVVLRHPRHLLRPRPGALSRRPKQSTPFSNLFLAGDWTDQDFFGTQEGAVRSGRLCAEAIVESFARARAAEVVSTLAAM